MRSNESIITESIAEVIEEGGLGRLARKSTSPQSQTGAKTWQPGSPPFRGMTGSPAGINIQDIAAESEEFAKEGGRHKPYPLDQVNNNLADAYICLSNTEAQLRASVKYNKVLTTNPEKKLVLDHCLKKVQAMKEMIKSISGDFDRITL